MNNPSNLPAVFKQPEVVLPIKVPQTAGDQKVLKFLVLFFVTLIALSFIVERAEYVKVTSTVVPSDKVVIVQHLYGGTVTEIFKKEGDLVKEGDALYKIELSVTALDLEGLKNKKQALLLSRKRRLAEVNGTDLIYSNEEIEANPDVTSTELSAFLSRKDRLNESVGVNQAQGAQAYSRLQELDSQIKRLESDLVSATRSAEIKMALYKGGHIGETEYLDSERAKNRVEGDLDVAKKSRFGLIAGQSEVTARQRDAKALYRTEAAEALAAIDKSISSLNDEIEKAKKQQTETLVTAQREGVLSNVSVTGIGYVIRPADKVAEIVPKEGGILVEGFLNASERGLVRVGMPVNVKIDSFDFMRYGVIEGQVSRISANSQTQPNGLHAFKVWIKPMKDYMGDIKDQYPVSVGMTAHSDIHVQDQTIFSWITSSLIRNASESFTEPSK